MTELAPVLVPTLSVLLLLAVPRAVLSVGVALASLAATVALLLQPPFAGDWLHRDAGNAPLLLAVGLVGLGAALVLDPGPDRRALLRAALPGLQAALTLALLAHSLGLMWVAIEAATLIAVAVLATDRTEAALAASWRLFLLGGTGIALALFGTVVLYLATGGGLAATTIAGAADAAATAPAPLLNLAFAFLLVGYGAKAGLAPLHLWVADAHAEGPAPLTGAMAGLLTVAALHALWRCAGIVGANPDAIAPALWLTAMGLGSVAVGVLALWRRHDARRFLGCAVVKSGGVALLAMAWAPRAAALLLAGQALAKAAAFIALGAAAQLRNGRGFAHLAGLGRDQPVLAAPLVVAFALAAGLPPGAPFMAEMMVVVGLAPAAPWAAMVLVVLLLAGLAAWLSRLHPLLPAGTAAPLPAAAGRAAAVAWALCAACVLLGLAG